MYLLPSLFITVNINTDQNSELYYGNGNTNRTDLGAQIARVMITVKDQRLHRNLLSNTTGSLLACVPHKVLLAAASMCLRRPGKLDILFKEFLVHVVCFRDVNVCSCPNNCSGIQVHAALPDQIFLVTNWWPLLCTEFQSLNLWWTDAWV